MYLDYKECRLVTITGEKKEGFFWIPFYFAKKGRTIVITDNNKSDRWEIKKVHNNRLKAEFISGNIIKESVITW